MIIGINAVNIKSGGGISHIENILVNLSRKILEKEIERLGKLPDAELQNLAKKADLEIGQVESKEDNMVKAKYWVK
jgi:hypothetical protein